MLKALEGNLVQRTWFIACRNGRTVAGDNSCDKSCMVRYFCCLLSLINNVRVPQPSGVRDEGRPLAIGLQEQVANRRKRRESKAQVVSVTEKAPQGVR